MVSREWRPAAVALAAEQHGVVTRHQLVDLGMSSSLVHDRLTAGELIRAAPHTYVFAAAPHNVTRTLAVAVLSRPSAFVSGRSAAWLHRFDGVALPVKVEITVPPTASGRSPVATVRRSQHFANIGTVTIDGLPTASGAETVFRMAQYVPAHRLSRFLDDMLIAQPDVVVALGEIYLRHQGERMKGMAILRPILLDRLSTLEVVNESALEELADEAFQELDAPQMRKQVPIPWAPSSGRVDRFIPEWGLIVELDGRRWHSRTEAFEADRGRDNAAAAAGFAVLRFTWQMLQQEPEKCRQLVLAVGSRASTAA